MLLLVVNVLNCSEVIKLAPFSVVERVMSVT